MPGTNLRGRRGFLHGVAGGDRAAAAALPLLSASRRRDTRRRWPQRGEWDQVVRQGRANDGTQIRAELEQAMASDG